MFCSHRPAQVWRWWWIPFTPRWPRTSRRRRGTATCEHWRRPWAHRRIPTRRWGVLEIPGDGGMEENPPGTFLGVGNLEDILVKRNLYMIMSGGFYDVLWFYDALWENRPWGVLIIFHPLRTWMMTGPKHQATVGWLLPYDIPIRSPWLIYEHFLTCIVVTNLVFELFWEVFRVLHLQNTDTKSPLISPFKYSISNSMWPVVPNMLLPHCTSDDNDNSRVSEPGPPWQMGCSLVTKHHNGHFPIGAEISHLLVAMFDSPIVMTSYDIPLLATVYLNLHPHKVPSGSNCWHC